jgi:prophage regulatory protein
MEISLELDDSPIRQKLDQIVQNQTRLEERMIAIEKCLRALSGQPISNRMLRMRDVVYLTGLSRSTIYKMISDERFPRPVRLSERAVAWELAAIEEFLHTRNLNKPSV